jgi:hypothetical protein
MRLLPVPQHCLSNFFDKNLVLCSPFLFSLGQRPQKIFRTKGKNCLSKYTVIYRLDAVTYILKGGKFKILSINSQTMMKPLYFLKSPLLHNTPSQHYNYRYFMTLDKIINCFNSLQHHEYPLWSTTICEHQIVSSIKHQNESTSYCLLPRAPQRVKIR